MRVSTKTRYGTRLMIELGLRYGEGPVYLKDIARVEEISEKYLSQIIIPLKNAGLVRSFRGAHGGYVLSRSPGEITLRDIVSVFEGDFELVGCVNKPESCNRTPVCVTQDLWREMGCRINDLLEEVSLEALVVRARERQQATTMYTI
jgi:Rrf2 family protein